MPLSVPHVDELVGDPTTEEAHHATEQGHGHDDYNASDLAVSCIAFIVILSGTIIGLIGNTVVCLVVYKNKQLRTSVNILVLNMAVVGLLTVFTSVPLAGTLVVYTIMFQQDPTEGKMFRIFVAENALFDFHTSVLLITMAYISVERYQAIAKPFQKSKRSKQSKRSIILAWTASIVSCVIYIATELYQTSAHVSIFKNTSNIDNVFQIYVFFPVCTVLVVVIFVYYVLIVKLIREHVEKNGSLGTGNKIAASAEQTDTAGSTIPQDSTPGSNTVHNIDEDGQMSSSVNDRVNTDKPGLKDTSDTKQNGKKQAKKTEVRRNIEVTTAKLVGGVIALFMLLWSPSQLFIIFDYVKHNIDKDGGILDHRSWEIELVFQTIAIFAFMVCPVIFASLSKSIQRDIKALIISCSTTQSAK